MPHKFIVGQEIAPLFLVKVRRSWSGTVGLGAVGRVGLGWARCGELRTGKLRYGGSRRSGSGAVWLGTVRLVKAVGLGYGEVRSV